MEDENVKHRGVIEEAGVAGGLLKDVPFTTNTGTFSLFGTVWLDYGVVTLDYGRKRLWFEPFAGAQSMADERDMRALVPVMDGNRLVVGVVWDEALRSLVRPGDRIVSTGGVATEVYGICDYVKRRIDAHKGTSVSVETQTGEVVEITL
jgi:hypothetical protein